MSDNNPITIFTQRTDVAILTTDETFLLELRKSVKATIRQAQWQLNEIDKRLSELRQSDIAA